MTSRRRFEMLDSSLRHGEHEIQGSIASIGHELRRNDWFISPEPASFRTHAV